MSSTRSCKQILKTRSSSSSKGSDLRRQVRHPSVPSGEPKSVRKGYKTRGKALRDSHSDTPLADNNQLYEEQQIMSPSAEFVIPHVRRDHASMHQGDGEESRPSGLYTSDVSTNSQMETMSPHHKGNGHATGSSIHDFDTVNTPNSSQSPSNYSTGGRSTGLPKKSIPPDNVSVRRVSQPTSGNSHFQRSLESAGLAGTQDKLRIEVGVYVRSTLFRFMKFASFQHLAVDGHVARNVWRSLGLRISKQGFANIWDDWVKKHVRNVINDKRSSCAQSLGVVVMGTYLRPFLASDIHIYDNLLLCF